MMTQTLKQYIKNVKLLGYWNYFAIVIKYVSISLSILVNLKEKDKASTSSTSTPTQLPSS